MKALKKMFVCSHEVHVLNPHMLVRVEQFGLGKAVYGTRPGPATLSRLPAEAWCTEWWHKGHKGSTFQFPRRHRLLWFCPTFKIWWPLFEEIADGPLVTQTKKCWDCEVVSSEHRVDGHEDDGEVRGLGTLPACLLVNLVENHSYIKFLYGFIVNALKTCDMK